MTLENDFGGYVMLARPGAPLSKQYSSLKLFMSAQPKLWNARVWGLGFGVLGLGFRA